MRLCIIPGCLKLLPPEELEHLDIPVGEGSNSPVNQVLYMSESDTLVSEGSNILSRQSTETTRFNSFTGNQTLDQREKSFKVIRFILIYLTWSRRIDAHSHLEAELKYRSLLNFMQKLL